MATIIYPETIDYEWMYQRPQQMLKAFASLGHRSIFYNFEYIFKKDQPVIEIQPNYFLCKPTVPLNQIGIEEPVVLWISYPANIGCIGKYNEKLVVFDALDEASDEFNYWAPDLEQMVNKSDIIFTTAKKMYEQHIKNHKNVYMCPNAADYEHFSKAQGNFAPRPEDMPKNDRPTIGYFGALATWIDWEIIRYLSAANPTFNFVMVGPLYAEFRSPCQAPNIYYVGRKDYSVLPNYLQYFDVCMIPFKVTPMIEGCNPIKMYEYLSAGKPVVTTDMPETAQYDMIYVGKSKEQFNQKIQQALLEKKDVNKINERIEFAKANSWTHRAAMAAEVIEKTYEEKYRK